MVGLNVRKWGFYDKTVKNVKPFCWWDAFRSIWMTQQNAPINERDVIIWDVLIAIISRNILRKFLGWQSLIRHACQFKLLNVQRIIYQATNSQPYFWQFHVFQRAYMKDYLSYSCFVTKFG
jgi:hypothetical protein